MRINTPEQAEDMLYSYRYPYTHENKIETYKILQKVITFKNKILESKARFQYFQHLIFLNEKDEAIPQYAWLLNFLKKNRDKGIDIDEVNIVWAFKWVIGDLPSFADIKLDKLNELWQQYVELYTEYNAGTKMIHYYNIDYQLGIGHFDKALEAVKSYKSSAAKSGFYDDCVACQKDGMITSYNMLGMYKNACKFNSKVGAPGFVCAEVPERTYAKICFSNMMVSDFESAEFFYRKAMESNKLKSSIYEHFYNLLYYLAIKKDFTVGLKIIRSQIGYTFQTKNDILSIKFMHASHYFLNEMKKAGHTKINIKAKELEFLEPKNGYHKMDVLLNWFEEKFNYHRLRLDNRNQNSTWSDYFSKLNSKLSKLSV